MASRTNKSLGQVLPGLMQERGLSYAKLSDLTRLVDEKQKGLSSGHIHKFTSGERTPTPSNIELIAAALSISAIYFREYREYLVGQEARLLAAKYGFDEVMESLRTVAKPEGLPKEK